jgi:hypothetical protein
MRAWQCDWHRTTCCGGAVPCTLTAATAAAAAGEVLCWGSAPYGVTGLCDLEPSRVPLPCSALPLTPQGNAVPAAALATGPLHSLAILNSQVGAGIMVQQQPHAMMLDWPALLMCRLCAIRPSYVQLCGVMLHCMSHWTCIGCAGVCNLHIRCNRHKRCTSGSCTRVAGWFGNGLGCGLVWAAGQHKTGAFVCLGVGHRFGWVMQGN